MTRNFYALPSVLPKYFLFLLFSFFLSSSHLAHAHALKFGFINIKEISPLTYQVNFNYSGTASNPQTATFVYPEFCRQDSQLVQGFKRYQKNQSYQLQCESPITLGRVGVAGISESGSQVMLQIQSLGQETFSYTLDDKGWNVNLAEALAAAISGNAQSSVSGYFTLGTEHILLGIDHLLFVTVLLMIVGMRRRLISVITCFTVGHSLTLGLASMGWLLLPAEPVEAMIALSIVLLAGEVAQRHSGMSAELSFTQRFPEWAAIGFGLFHGLGFAGALQEIGLPEDDWVISLLLFNLGIEAGQLIFIAAVFCLLWLLTRGLAITKQRSIQAQQITTYAIGITAAFWFFERSTLIFFME